MGRMPYVGVLYTNGCQRLLGHPAYRVGLRRGQEGEKEVQYLETVANVLAWGPVGEGAGIAERMPGKGIPQEAILSLPHRTPDHGR